MKYNCEGQISIFDILKPADTKVIYQAKDFITEIVLHGSGYSKGKSRIMSLYKSNMTKADRVKAIKSEYGIGGCGWPLDGYGLHGYDYIKGNGITAEWNDEEAERKTGLITWKEIEEEIHRLIDQGKYYTERDIKYN